MISFTPSEVEALTKNPEFKPIPDGHYAAVITAAKEGLSRDQKRKALQLTFRTSGGRVVNTSINVDAEDVRSRLLSEIGEGEPTDEQRLAIERLNYDTIKLRGLITSTGLKDKLVADMVLLPEDFVGKAVEIGIKNSKVGEKSYTNVSYIRSPKQEKVSPAIGE